jgi:hypothetical protein
VVAGWAVHPGPACCGPEQPASNTAAATSDMAEGTDDRGVPVMGASLAPEHPPPRPPRRCFLRCRRCSPSVPVRPPAAHRPPCRRRTFPALPCD